jgi:CheY-like chemotaxis protein
VPNTRGGAWIIQTRVARPDDRVLASMILIVEDDDEVREMIRAILEAEGYRTEGAPNGREALKLLLRGKELPDLILCDLLMPVTDGADLLESLRPHEALRSIPFVFMTGDVDLLREPVGKSHAPPLLPKPLDTDVLLGIVREHCRRQAPTKQSGFSGVWRRLRGTGPAPRTGSSVSRGQRR